MIPRAHITAWRSRAPWPLDAQVEQDLVLSRALVELYRNPLISRTMAFRGGTALHKLFFPEPGRYSEDIDLVQIDSGPIGSIIDAARASLNSWLGEPKRKQSQGRVTMVYRFETTTRPVQQMRLKIEINTREHFSILGIQQRPFVVDNPWFSGSANIGVYRIEELMGTKMRALYQRKKGRDLYDLWLALTYLDVEDELASDCFERYLANDNLAVSRAEFEMNIEGKFRDQSFLDDITPLLPVSISYDAAAAGELVGRRLIARLPGDPWKSTDSR